MSSHREGCPSLSQKEVLDKICVLWVGCEGIGPSLHRDRWGTP